MVQLRDVHPKLAMDSIVRGVTALQERSLRSAGLDLTIQQATLATVLLEVGEQSLNELTSRFEINQSAMTRLVDRLEAKGVVRRSSSAVDGRVVNVALTATGADLATTARQVIEQLKSSLLAGIDEAELEAFWKVLAQMQEVVAEQQEARS